MIYYGEYVLFLCLFLPLLWRLWKPKPREAPEARRNSLSTEPPPPTSGWSNLCFLPPCTPSFNMFQSNQLEPEAYECEHVSCKCLFLHKPTMDADLLLAGNYPYAEHMHGRKRIWELRVQMTVKKAFKGRIYIGRCQDYGGKSSFAMRMLHDQLM